MNKLWTEVQNFILMIVQTSFLETGEEDEIQCKISYNAMTTNENGKSFKQI
jgi:hypothetical protein